MYYTIYKTTNLINGKIYIGQHKTKDLNDGYLGSGKTLNYAIKKYGRHNFKKEILYVFPTKEEMNAKEAELVTEKFASRDDVYNVKKGGTGGWDHIDNSSLNKMPGYEAGLNTFETRSKSSKTKWKDEEYRDKILPILANAFKGKTHTEEAKAKIGKANKEHQLKNNSMKNRCWIYSNELKISKVVHLDDLDYHLNNGWLKGRKIKFGYHER